MDPRARLWDWRLVLLLSLAVVAAGVALRLPAIPQDPAYHAFADQRTLLGVPNALNVLSNLPFVAVGFVGLRLVVAATGGAAWERAAFLILFAGVTLTGAGSGYYHLAPSTPALFWDRLPMTLAFMALFALTLGERVGPRAGPWLLPLFLAAGLGSVVSWRSSELGGTGDLRLFGLVQFLPMVIMPLALLIYPRRWIPGADLAAVVGWYALSKVFEALDPQIYALGGIVSGHTLKHLAAATATAWILCLAAGWRRARG